MYHIKEAAQLSGVSVKTLHHYDKIGLLVPFKVRKTAIEPTVRRIWNAFRLFFITNT